MRCCIGLPTNRPIKQRTVECLLNLVVHSKHEFLIITATDGYTPSEKRNFIAVQAVNAKCDYIFFTDDDMLFPPETLEVLLSREKDVTGALYYQRVLPLRPVVELWEGQSMADKLFKVKGVGLGLVLIKCSILSKVKTPWFDTQVNEYGWTKLGDSYFFCDRVREAGFEVWCDPSLSIGHLSDYIYGL